MSELRPDCGYGAGYLGKTFLAALCFPWLSERYPLILAGVKDGCRLDMRDARVYPNLYPGSRKYGELRITERKANASTAPCVPSVAGGSASGRMVGRSGLGLLS